MGNFSYKTKDTFGEVTFQASYKISMFIQEYVIERLNQDVTLIKKKSKRWNNCTVVVFKNPNLDWFTNYDWKIYN